MLAKLTNSGAFKFLNKNKKVILCVVAALVIVLALVGYFRNFRRENFTETEDKPTFRFFYVDWCPHCKQAKPEFKNCSNPSVKFETINCEDPKNKELIQGYDIEGYPTIILDKDGKQISYEGERTAEAMEQFLNEQL